MKILLDDRAAIVELKGNRLLLIADLHLGYEVTLSERVKVDFPDQQNLILSCILKIVEQHKISTLYILGDVKHTLQVDSPFNWQAIPKFFETLVSKIDVSIILGNHDGDILPLLPKKVRKENPHGIVLRDDENSLGLLHGHAWPSTEVLGADLILCGHNHPSIRRNRIVSVPKINRQQRSRLASTLPVVIKSRLDRNCVRIALGLQPEKEIAETTLLTLPAFNHLIRGVNIAKPDMSFQGPLFDNGCATLPQSEVYSVDGIYLGTVEELQSQNTLHWTQRND